jgi:hypothetical protein
MSGENLRLARAIFDHPRSEYRKADVIRDPFDGEWQAIVLPDVYEHIPKAAREVLHEKLDPLLCSDGKILFTVPGPGAIPRHPPLVSRKPGAVQTRQVRLAISSSVRLSKIDEF